MDFEWEQLVDEQGNQIQDTSHPGARPFNKAEIEHIKRVDTCMACHSEMDSDAWERLMDKFGTATDDETHKQIIKELLKEGAK